MIELLRGASNEAIEAALLEGASSLSNSIDESVPLDDYRESVSIFVSALAKSLDDQVAA